MTDPNDGLVMILILFHPRKLKTLNVFFYGRKYLLGIKRQIGLMIDMVIAALGRYSAYSYL